MPHIKDVLDALYGEAYVGICYAAPRRGPCELEKTLTLHGYNPLDGLNLLREIEIQKMCEGAAPIVLTDSNWKASANTTAWEMTRAVPKPSVATAWETARLYLLRQEHLGEVVRSFQAAYQRAFVCPGHNDGTCLYCDFCRGENLRVAHYYDLGLPLGDGSLN